jgi:hypothetical protein
MQKYGNALGFAELSPPKIASELFSLLKPGDKVAVLGRFHKSFDNSARDKIVDALQRRGLVVRVIENQTSPEDFCFLKSAQKELVGTYRSSFVRWAVYLGDAKLSRLYSLNYTGTRNMHGENFFQAVAYPWTHPSIRSRLRYELYQSEEVL